GVEKDACPHDLAPTPVSTAALALGDALAVALLDAHGFAAADFAHMRPRGGLPDQAKVQHAFLRIEAVMRAGSDIPRLRSGASIREAVAEMSRGRMGMTAVLDTGHGV